MADIDLGYILMRKDDPITYAEFTSDGNMISYSRDIKNEELAPLQDRYQNNWLNLWWKERSIPIEQDNIEKFLRANGYSMPSDYLIKNLGLSLTDYYWIKPVASNLTWKDVNLFDNDFKSNLLNWSKGEVKHADGEAPHYSPNGSLQGTIEKTWTINNGDRYLIKGNHSPKSSESINELIACEIHKRQGHNNYCDYGLIEISGKEYAFGCYSKLFTSQNIELVSAWALYTNEKKPNSVSSYEHLLKMCGKFGMDTQEIRHGLEYQILTDFIISGHDRHLNNIAFLRDADTLKFTGLAPIYDSGGALFANKAIPKNERELLDIDTHSFTKKESGLIKLVEDKNAIDLTKLPPASFVRELYEKDPKMDEKEIKNIAHWYERKIELCREIQLGRDVFGKVYMSGNPKKDAIKTVNLQIPPELKVSTSTNPDLENGIMLITPTEQINGCEIKYVMDLNKSNVTVVVNDEPKGQVPITEDTPRQMLAFKNSIKKSLKQAATKENVRDNQTKRNTTPSGNDER